MPLPKIKAKKVVAASENAKPSEKAAGSQAISWSLLHHGTSANEDFSDVATIGIPRSFMYYRYPALWTTYFTELGYDVVLSEPTTRQTVDQGSALATDESCLASKMYLGHVEALRNTCDCMFVPCLDNVGTRLGFCTKFQALPDLVHTTFADSNLRILTCQVNTIITKKDMTDAFVELGITLGKTVKQTKAAWKAAQKAQVAYEKERAKQLQNTIARVHKEQAQGKDSLLILLVAHPYLSFDPMVGGEIVDMVEKLGATVIFACDADRKKSLATSFDFSETMPWIVNRELVGALMNLHEDIDGILLVSAFPCGPDSMTDDAIMRCIQGTPLLNLVVDAQSGTAGLETRIESFVDILRYRKRGGYIHDAAPVQGANYGEQ